MAVEHAQAPRADNQQPGSREENADDLNGQVALRLCNPARSSRSGTG